MAIILLEIFGGVSAYFLWRITKTGTFWVSYWERKLSEIEDVALGKFKIFRDHPAFSDEARERAKREGYVSSKETIKLFSFLFIIVWLGLFFYTIYVIYFN